MKERIVTNAWELVTEFPSLKKLNFLPSFFGTSWLFIILLYQVSYSLVLFFKKEDETFQFLFRELPTKSYFGWIIAGIILIFLLYMLTNPLSRGGMIHMMKTFRGNDENKIHRSWQGLFDGFRHFLPMFEIQNITAIFSPLTIITSAIFMWRFLDSSFHTMIIWVTIAYMLLSFFLNMCFAYSPFFVVLEDKKGTESLSASTGLAIGNIAITSRLYFTNLLLHLRIVIIGGFFLLMPFILSSVLTYFTLESVQIIFMIIFGIISLIFFIFIVHLNSTLEIFILSLWYEAYLACKENES